MIYHQVGERGFWIDERYLGRVVALRAWPSPDMYAEVLASANTLRELEIIMRNDFWQKNGQGARTAFSYPICRIL